MKELFSNMTKQTVNTNTHCWAPFDYSVCVRKFSVHRGLHWKNALCTHMGHDWAQRQFPISREISSEDAFVGSNLQKQQRMKAAGGLICNKKEDRAIFRMEKGKESLQIFILVWKRHSFAWISEGRGRPLWSTGNFCTTVNGSTSTQAEIIVESCWVKVKLESWHH